MRRPYLRSMDSRWWAHAPYRGYTLREATGAAIAAYAILLMAGVVCLALGEHAYGAWIGFLASPWSKVLHAVILVAVLFHAWSWNAILPKTMPRLVIGGRYVEPRIITAIGLAASVLGSAALLLVLFWIMS